MAANTSANVGKAQSTLLAKHVRTLEVLFSLQRENARIRQEGQGKTGEEEVQKRIVEAVTAAVAGPNELVEELQSQIAKLRSKVDGFEENLAAARRKSAKMLDDARSQMEELHIANQKLQEMCSNLESEAGRQARHAASQGELTLKLSELTTVLAAEERKTENLARRLQHRETEFNALRLRLKDEEKKITFMEVTEASLRISVDGNASRVCDLEGEVRQLLEKLHIGETEKKSLDVHYAQALRDAERVQKEVAGMSDLEQELRETVDEQSSRANAAEAKLAAERKRSHHLREEGRRRLQEQSFKNNESLEVYCCERETLLSRVEQLSREVLALREHMSNDRSQFSKYVDAKTENHQLKEQLDELKEKITAPRAPNRMNITHSTMNSNKCVSVDRLRNSIGVTRATNNNHNHSNSVVSALAAGYQESSSSSLLRGGEGGGDGGEVNVSIATRNSSKTKMFLPDTAISPGTVVGSTNSARSSSNSTSAALMAAVAQARQNTAEAGGGGVACVGSKITNTRRHSLAGGTWTGAAPCGGRAPGYELSVPPLGSVRGDETVRRRLPRVHQVF